MPKNARFERLNGLGAQDLRPTVEAIYRRSYTDAIARGKPFDSVERFMDRFDYYTRLPGFDFVLALDESGPIGQTWGWPLGVGSRRWSSVQPYHELEPGFTEEDGHRTFILSEIMVLKSVAGQGVAHRLHDELFAGRSEERASLLVELGNETARRAYVSWGWTVIGRSRPSWEDAPIYDVMMLSLPLSLGARR